MKKIINSSAKIGALGKDRKAAWILHISGGENRDSEFHVYSNTTSTTTTITTGEGDFFFVGFEYLGVANEFLAQKRWMCRSLSGQRL